MSSDQIAYLRDLAVSHYNDGNYTACIAAWQQVLAIDPSNTEAKQGVTVAQMKAEGGSDWDAGPFGGDPQGGGGGQQDPDATMMFSAPAGGPFGEPAAPPSKPAAQAPPFQPEAPSFDADRTMVFQGSPSPPAPASQPPLAPPGGFDADRTMVFNPAAAPPAAPSTARPNIPLAPSAPPAKAPAGGGFDADKTMVFNPAASPPAPPPAAPPTSAGGDFDADRTMVFNPSLAPPPAAPWEAPPSAEGGDSDRTMLSGPGGFSLGSPEPESGAAPSPFLGSKPAAPSSGSKPLQDFSMPSGPPGFGTPSAPDLPAPPSSGSAPTSSGFSFELPPPPARGGGGGLPDLPSVGLPSPPPAFTPSPPSLEPPPPKKAPGAQFGEVEAGEIESLAVPTVAPSKPSTTDSGVSQKEREEQLKREYEQQYGRTPVVAPPPPRPSASARPAVSRKFVLGLVGVLTVVLAGGYLGIQAYVARTNEKFIPPVKEPDPTAGLSKEKAEAQINERLFDAERAQREGKLEDAELAIEQARSIALKNNIPVPQRVILKGDEIEREQQYQEAFGRAVRGFCIEDYPRANVAFLDLERQRPDKLEAGRYIEHIFWNLAVEKLQQKEPWEAVYYLESLTQRNPNDVMAGKLLAYAKRFKAGDEMGDAYLDVVDPLTTRTAGCQ